MDEPLEFSSKITEFSELSNFHVAPFTINDQIWQTVEHFFQAQKFPTDKTLQEKIRLAKSPTVAKRLGRTKTHHFRSDWEQVKEELMLQALTAKFEQNPQLKALLMSTGTRELKEKASWDSYWGTGRTGKGKNRMGFLLSKLRLANK